MGDASSPRIPGKVIGWDKTMDLAVIKTEIKPEYVFSIADWVKAQTGDHVYAIGSPVGLEKTVTQGIVSNNARPGILSLSNVIQVDAAVNPGNSGGPVISTDGRLVGVAFAGAADYQGLNFAIPAATLAAELPALLRGGKVEHPWIGLCVNETHDGAQIVYVSPNTPAGEQRMKEGSTLISIDGTAFKEPLGGAPEGGLIPTMQRYLFPFRPGELISLETMPKSGGSSTVKRVLRLDSRPDLPLAEAAKADTKERLVAPLFGIILGSPGGGAVYPVYVVRQVIPGSAADGAGLSPNDPISIRAFQIDVKQGIAAVQIATKLLSQGYMDREMQLAAGLDSPNLL
jgi:S1-C subfamily serine protease